MLSIDNDMLFEKYYQKEYDFNTTSLSDDEVDEIKKFVREKRVDYGIAPLGVNAFEWISMQNTNLRFESVDFESEDIDGMLFIPTSGEERAYIVINSSKPLINQIFAACHEYYHYEKDYSKIKSEPYICNFNSLKDINEKKASRFAAELLLPEEALKNEFKSFLRKVGKRQEDSLSFPEYAALLIYLTIKYQIPLKAALYRLKEEQYIDEIEQYTKEIDFIKSILQEAKILKNKVDALYSIKNDYISLFNIEYKDIEKTYLAGFANEQEIIDDSQKLGLDLEIIKGIIDDHDNDTDECDDLLPDLF